MRIFHVTSHLDVGGVTSSVLSLSSELARRGHHVTIASGGGSLEPQALALSLQHWRVPLRTSQEFRPGVFAATRTLAARLVKEPVDVLHGHTRVGQVVACRPSRRLRLPYVTTWHGFFRPTLGRRLWPCTGDATIAISDPVRRHLIDTFRVPAERVHLIPHGIDAAPFEAPVAPAEQDRLRQTLGLGRGVPVVGTVARLVASKGVDHLVRSFRRVRSELPAAQLVIVGDGEQRAHLERLAQEQDLGGAVRFAGTLPETRVALSLMDAFVFLPADREGFGLSLLEAMAGAKPIVAVRQGGGAPWVLEQSGVGTLVEPGDGPALASAITRLLRDRNTARREGERGRAVVKERYSLSRMVSEVEALYGQVLRHTRA